MSDDRAFGSRTVVCLCALVAVVALLPYVAGCSMAWSDDLISGPKYKTVRVHYKYVAFGSSSRVAELAGMPNSPGLFAPRDVVARLWPGNDPKLSEVIRFINVPPMRLTNQSGHEFEYWFASVWNAYPSFRQTCRLYGMLAPNEAGLPHSSLDIVNLNWDAYLIDSYLFHLGHLQRSFRPQVTEYWTKDRTIGVFFVDNPSGFPSDSRIGRFDEGRMICIINRRMLEYCYLYEFDVWDQWPDECTDSLLQQMQARTVSHEVFHYILGGVHHLDIEPAGTETRCCFYQAQDLKGTARKVVNSLCTRCWTSVAWSRSFSSF